MNGRLIMRDWAVVLALVSVLADTGAAQQVNSQCSALLTSDGCQKATDAFKYLSPQYGTLITGAHPLMGQGSVLAFMGSGRSTPPFSAGVRANIVSISIPDLHQLTYRTDGPDNSQPIPVRDVTVVAPSLDVAMGFFSGFDVGITDVFAIDFFANAVIVPDLEEEELSVQKIASGLKLGYGSRVGVIQESVYIPSFVVSYGRRWFPKMDVVTVVETEDIPVQINIRSMRKVTDTWRLSLGKTVGPVSLIVGKGQDTHASRAGINVVYAAANSGLVKASSKVKQDVVFADLAVRLGSIRLVGEVGQVSGGNINSFNPFENSVYDATRTFASVGVRFAF